MTPSPPIDDRSDTCYSGRLAAGSDQTRSGPLNGPAVTPPIGSCNMRSTHVQVFGRRDDEAIPGHRRPASEKRQGTKSREVGR